MYAILTDNHEGNAGRWQLSVFKGGMLSRQLKGCSRHLLTQEFQGWEDNTFRYTVCHAPVC